MKYKVNFTKSDEGYSVSVPGLPGCLLQRRTCAPSFWSIRIWRRSQGETEAEALVNIKDAIEAYLQTIWEGA
jgi:predicted RNase H-like HicB family nuclease